MKRYELFELAMDQFNILAKLSIAALNPYASHSGNCSSDCPQCRLRKYYDQIKSLITETK